MISQCNLLCIGNLFVNFSDLILCSDITDLILVAVYGLWVPQLGEMYDDDVPVLSQKHQQDTPECHRGHQQVCQ